MKGKITRIEGTPKAHSYIIRGEDGKDYYAHLEDIKENEDILYKHPTTLSLNIQDDVEFKPIEKKPRAINVKKV
jgi:cold shock CspA family protein